MEGEWVKPEVPSAFVDGRVRSKVKERDEDIVE
jgi:hypothetical protein